VQPDSVQCTRSIQGWTSHSRVSSGTLRYNSPDCPVCHRTVRCTSGATAFQRNGRLQRHLTSAAVHGRVRVQSQSAPDNEQELSGAAPDCLVPQEVNGANGRLLPNPNGWVTLWRNRPNYSSLSDQVAPLRAATHLNMNNPSVPRI
jgi:hypothetical protein